MGLKLHLIQKDNVWYILNIINCCKLKVYPVLFYVLSIWTTTKFTNILKQAYLTIFHVSKLQDLAHYSKITRNDRMQTVGKVSRSLLPMRRLSLWTHLVPPGTERFLTDAVSLNDIITNHSSEETRDQSRCMRQGRTSPHCDPSPSDPSLALRKRRSGSPRRVATYGAAAGLANQHNRCKNGGRSAWWCNWNPVQGIPKHWNKDTRKWVPAFPTNIRRFGKAMWQLLQIASSSEMWNCIVLRLRKNVWEQHIAAIFSIDEGGSRFLRKVWICLQEYTASYLWRTYSQ